MRVWQLFALVKKKECDMFFGQGVITNLSIDLQGTFTRFHILSELAAKFEREYNYIQAYEYWIQAATVSRHPLNQNWCENRAMLCYKKEKKTEKITKEKFHRQGGF